MKAKKQEVSKARRKLSREMVNEGLEIAAVNIPTTWLDPLLTGPEAVIGKPPYGCPDIERLLTALQARIRALVEVSRGSK